MLLQLDGKLVDVYAGPSTLGLIDGFFFSVQFDGKLVVSGAYDYLVKVWDPLEGNCLHTLSGHTNRVYSLQVCVWCMYTLHCLRKLWFRLMLSLMVYTL